MKKILVIAPHPDDETLGCGGTILKNIAQGNEVSWLIMTTIGKELGYNQDQIEKREKEIDSVSKAYGLKNTFRLPHLTSLLDKQDFGILISDVKKIFEEYTPEEIYLPFSGDIHSDHKITFNACVSSSKCFRTPFIKKIYCYETISETDFAIDPVAIKFNPNIFVNITDQINEKIEIMKNYDGEMKSPPFPRSEESIRALATLRGASSNYNSAEAFILLKERID